VSAKGWPKKDDFGGAGRIGNKRCNQTKAKYGAESLVFGKCYHSGKPFFKSIVTKQFTFL